MTKVFHLIGKKNSKNKDTINEQEVCPEVHVLQGWGVQLVDQDVLKSKDEEHQEKLGRCFEDSILQYISKNNNFIDENQQSQIESGFLGLLL